MAEAGAGEAVEEIVIGAFTMFLDDPCLDGVLSDNIIKSKAYAKKLLEEAKLQKSVFKNFCTSMECLFRSILVAAAKVPLITTKRTKCWSNFHEVRNEKIPPLWEKLHKELNIDGRSNHLVVHSISQNLFEDMIKRFFSGCG